MAAAGGVDALSRGHGVRGQRGPAALVAGITGEAELTDERLAALMVALRALPERPHGETRDRCQAERPFLEDRLRQGLRLSKVHRLLRRRGVEVPYPTLHRFAVAELGFGRTAATIPVADCGPGEEVQLDTGWMGLLEPDLFGQRRRFKLKNRIQQSQPSHMISKPTNGRTNTIFCRR